jgi:hypothetical protein
MEIDFDLEAQGALLGSQLAKDLCTELTELNFTNSL